MATGVYEKASGVVEQVVNFDNFKGRCSSIEDLMSNPASNRSLTEKQAVELEKLEKKQDRTPNQDAEMLRLQELRENGKKVVLSQTTIDYLLGEYARKVYGKEDAKKDLEVDHTAKGKEGEAEAIKLISHINKRHYIKNPYRYYNDFLSGEMDVIDMTDDALPIEVLDTKCAWDSPGFLKKIVTPVLKSNDLQVKGYMDILECGKGTIAHCLVNNPEWQILKFIESAKIQMKVIYDEDPAFLKKAAQIEKNMRFDDIPAAQRVYQIPVEPFTQEYRQLLYDRVKICRDWLNTFHEKMSKLQ